MLTEEQAGAAYEEAADGCRRSVLGTRDNALHWQRVKRREIDAFADLDCEKVPTWNEHAPQATPLRASTCA